MADYNKFQDFVEQLCTGVHNFTAAGHTFRIFLTNELPLASDTQKSDMTEIGAGNGYTAGGEDVQNTLAEASGTATVTGTEVTWNASGTVGPFRYVVLYNDNATNDELVAWWDHGSVVTLQNGESYNVQFNGGSPTGTIFTVT